MNRKFIYLLFFLFCVLSCRNKSVPIYCDFTENSFFFMKENYHKISYKMKYTDIEKNNMDYFNFEIDFFNYFLKIPITPWKIDEKEFINNYNLLIHNIPEKINIIFCDIINTNTYEYKNFIDFKIILYLTYFELVYEGKITEDYNNNDRKNYINKKNIDRIKKLFFIDDINIFETNKGHVIEMKIFDIDEIYKYKENE